jgi:protein-tyrosine phosphatase
MVDLHCHVLPGVDDGPSTTEVSLELCRAARAAGTTTIVATPHVNWDYPQVGAALVHSAVVALNVALGVEQIEVQIRPGAEVALARAGELPDHELDALRLGSGPFLLVEGPSSAVGFGHALSLLASRGYGIVLAHPERSRVLRRRPELLERLLGAGMLCCVTAASLNGHNGRDARTFAWDLLAQGRTHVIASDAHHPVARPPDLAGELERAGLTADEIDHFARLMPQAIVDGSALPAVRAVRRRRKLPLKRRSGS